MVPPTPVTDTVCGGFGVGPLLDCVNERVILPAYRYSSLSAETTNVTVMFCGLFATFNGLVAVRATVPV